MFYIVMKYPDGVEDELDETFDTQEAAEEKALYYCSCYKQGGEILNMSNPGDYPTADTECDYQIIEK